MVKERRGKERLDVSGGLASPRLSWPQFVDGRIRYLVNSQGQGTTCRYKRGSQRRHADGNNLQLVVNELNGRESRHGCGCWVSSASALSPIIKSENQSLHIMKFHAPEKASSASHQTGNSFVFVSEYK